MADEKQYPRYTVSSLTSSLKSALEGGFSDVILMPITKEKVSRIVG